MKKILFSIVILTALCFTQVEAQLKTPAPSPGATVTQKVGVSEIAIDYSRPSMKGRKIFGGLVPFGELWRTGANASTKVTFADDVTVGGVALKAGKYALFTFPGESEWTVVFYGDAEVSGTPGDKYDPKQEVAKFKVKSQKLSDKVETFTIDVANLTDASAEITLLWENTKVVIPVKFDTEKMVMTSIDEVMAGPSQRDYYSAARYYFDNGKDLNTAYKWITKATEGDGNAFWMLRLKSQIEAGLGKYKEAINTATKSKELAEKAGNKQYVKFNEDAIKEWSKK